MWLNIGVHLVCPYFSWADFSRFCSAMLAVRGGFVATGVNPDIICAIRFLFFQRLSIGSLLLQR